MSLHTIIDNITSPDLVEDDYTALLDAVEIINANPGPNIPEALRLLKLKLQSSNGNTLLRSLTLLDFFAENCGAAMKAQIGSNSFIAENLIPILDDGRIHITVKYQVVKEMYKISKSFASDESLSSMKYAFEELKSKYPTLTQQAMGEIDGGNKTQLPPIQQPTEEDEELKRAIALSLRDSTSASYRPPAMVPPALNQRFSNASHMPVPMVQVSSLPQQPIQQQQQTFQQPVQQQQQTFQQPVQQQQQTSQQPAQQQPIQSLENQLSGGSFMASLLQESTNAPEKVIALFDLKSDDEDTLSFEKDDIITVVEKINDDWIRGCLHGNAGIVPVNYVKTIPKTTESDLRQLIQSLDTSFDIETTLSKLLDLNKKIKTTPMTSQQFESCLLENQFPTKIQNIEQLKIDFKKILELHRMKLLELESIKSNMDSSLETYQSMVVDIAPTPEDPSIAQFINAYPDIGSLNIGSPVVPQQAPQQPTGYQPFGNLLQSNQTGSANAYLKR